MKIEDFGSVRGQIIKKYTISSGRMSVELISYGARVRSIILTLSDGTTRDVALGYNSAEEYASQDGNLGATMGRVTNRIAGGKYTLNEKVFTLNKNDGQNTLHGGFSGFADKIWQVIDYGENFITFKYLSVDGEEGFGGNLSITIKYTITENNSLKMEYRATTDADTPISVTNHAYFNLNGENGKNVFDTQLQIYADYITPLNDERITDGRYMSVVGTVYNFTKGKKIGDYYNSDDEYLKKFGGYDINYMPNGKGYRLIASAKDGGIELQVYSDAVGVQFFTENSLDGRKGKSCTYKKGAGFCLETQNVPNAVNCKEYPSCILKKGEEYKTTTEYMFKF